MTKKQIVKLAQLIDAKRGDSTFNLMTAEDRQQELGDLILAFTSEHNRAIQYRKHMKQRGRRVQRRTLPFGRTVTITPVKGE